MNVIEKIIAILLAAILLFICPIQSIAQKQDIVVQQYVTMESSYLVDSIRNLGYMSRQMYEQYLKKINIGKNLYEVEITHYHTVYHQDKEHDDVKKHYNCIYMKDIMKVIYDDTHEGYYTFQKDDYITIQVKQKHKTMAEHFQQYLLGLNLDEDNYVTIYGGLIKDEAY